MTEELSNEKLAWMQSCIHALHFIALQPCTMDAEGAAEDCACIETGACITEYCWPCYAKAHIKRNPDTEEEE